LYDYSYSYEKKIFARKISRAVLFKVAAKTADKSAKDEYKSFRKRLKRNRSDRALEETTSKLIELGGRSASKRKWVVNSSRFDGETKIRLIRLLRDVEANIQLAKRKFTRWKNT
jgi:hypothetical protein